MIIDYPALYASVFALLFLLRVLYVLALSLLGLWSRVVAFTLRSLVYPRLPIWVAETRLDLLVFLLVVVANGLCCVLGVSGVDGFHSRIGKVTLANLTLLSLGGRVTAVSNFLGLGCKHTKLIHRWVAIIVVVEGGLHGLLAFLGHRTKIFTQLQIIYALLPFASLIACFIFLPLKTSLYELFLVIHNALALTCLVAIWLHLWRYVRERDVFVIVSLVLTLVLLCCQPLGVIYRNFPFRQRFHRLSVFKQNDALILKLHIQRPWGFRAGQYVYLCVPAASPFASFEFHPFFIAWWERTANGEAIAHFLVQPRFGFTRDLLRCLSYETTADVRSTSSCTAFIEGPYGITHHLSDYGTIILLASGIGICAQLPYIQQAVADHKARKVKTQKIELHWILEKESQQDWVKSWMDEILEADAKYVRIEI
ncbi:hypothetical protein AOL_s00091g11 [Orbilia oligospora ATCC 24927]|uniref:FAD-binding FR-type domain-containing protein n=1 Tax=Arthrobotrys oligospora (strain ATCC 24927 / CBS 115.81 / DSM 1491) TaxID=756982 RepID=G1XHV9_ARTOA|nr:hypothetical protein AOL_s00091g11 [Orbilia oligospora ATCC 24927]EGX47267.1 hypothetical protein AOL_s00091g11 [Orbilia oligospora ATCC 24927]